MAPRFSEKIRLELVDDMGSDEITVIVSINLF